MNEIIKLKLTPTWDLYPKTATDYRIYACTTEDEEIPIHLNEKGQFIINGDMPELRLGEDYIAEIQEFTHVKYGIGYKLISIKQEIPKTVAGQYAFLRTIIAESYVNVIQAAYPDAVDIVDQIRNHTLDYSKLKGIGDKVFIDRIQKPVIENFEISDALIELSPLGVTNTIIRKLIAHYGGSVALTIQKVKENIYILCEEVSGIGFKTVDEYALKSGVKEDSPYRINACIEYLLGKEEQEGHCWVEKDTLIEKVMDEADLEYKVVSEHLKSEQFMNVKDGSWNKFYIDDWRVGLYRNYYYEDKISEYVLEMLGSEVVTKVDDLDGKIKVIEEQQGFEFTDEQKQGIQMAVDNNIVLVSGKAGSGKSSLLKGMLGVLSDYTYETCALSGKAAQRIIEATGLKSQTIHRLLGYNPAGGFALGRDMRLDRDNLALDEGSMVNNFIFFKLSSAIKENGKLIILGDVQQLATLGCGAVFIDLINSGVIPLIELTEVHRQARASGILSYANMIREGIQINKRGDYANKTVGELQDLTLIPFDRKPDIASHIIDICKKIKDRVDLMEFQIIVPMKERGDLCTKNLNLALQPIFNPNEDEGLKRNGYDFKVGDKIIKRGNDYDNFVFNGTLGTIKWIDLDKKIAGFLFVDRDEIITYSQEDMKDIDMAYALTTHSNQGSQYDNGICALDYSSYKLLSKQHAYTMLTRFSKKCMFLFENEALRYAISNDETVDRNTFLPELLVSRVKEFENFKGKV